MNLFVYSEKKVFNKALILQSRGVFWFTQPNDPQTNNNFVVSNSPSLALPSLNLCVISVKLEIVIYTNPTVGMFVSIFGNPKV